MQLIHIHHPYDRYSVVFPDVGIMFLAEVEWKTFRTHRIHDHQEVQVLWILEGTMGLEIDGRRFQLSAGGCYVIPADRVHSVFQLEEAPRVVFLDLRVPPGPASPMTAFLEKLAPRMILRTDPARLRKGAARLRRALARPSLRGTARVQALLWDLLADTVARIPVDCHEPEETVDPRLHAADQFLQDHAAQPLSVEAVAATVGLSRSQLTRLFRAHFGLGPAERLRQYRIEKARTLLADSTLTLKEVACVCGFACPNHFCRVFQQLTRTTPTQFRRAQIKKRRR